MLSLQQLERAIGQGCQDFAEFKCFGRLRREGKTFYRNYHRELKNRQGLSSRDVIIEQYCRPSPWIKYFPKLQEVTNASL